MVKAKYNCKCTRCGKVINEGDEIEFIPVNYCKRDHVGRRFGYSQKMKPVHKECPHVTEMKKALTFNESIYNGAVKYAAYAGVNLIDAIVDSTFGFIDKEEAEVIIKSVEGSVEI